MGYMLICTSKPQGKKDFEKIFEDKANEDENFTWITGIDGWEKEIKKGPFIGGSFDSIFEKKDVFLALITFKTKTRLAHVLKRIKELKDYREVYKISIVPIFNDIEDLGVN